LKALDRVRGVLKMSEAEHVVCLHCAGVNRVPATAKALAAKCGRCGERLFTGHPADVDGAMFERQVARSTIPVLVDVWAPWCGPCRVMAPAYEAAAKALEPAVRVIKLNSDNEQQIAGRLGIRGIPSLLLFRSGTEIARSAGAMPAGQIVEWTRARLTSRPS